MTEPLLSLSAAVKAVEVSRSTLQRRLRDGAIVGAVRDPDTGGWSIPISGLIAAGLAPRTTPPDTTTEVDPDTAVRDLEAERDRLRVELEMWRTLATERAEALATERDRVRELLARNPTPSEVVHVEPKTPEVGTDTALRQLEAITARLDNLEADRPARRRWWSR